MISNSDCHVGYGFKIFTVRRHEIARSLFNKAKIYNHFWRISGTFEKKRSDDQAHAEQTFGINS